MTKDPRQSPDPGLSLNPRVMMNPRLTLVSISGKVPAPRPLPQSASRLAHAVVDAARFWGDVALESPEIIDSSTEEGRLRLAVLDAVHDLEFAETNMAARPRMGERPLLGDGAG